MVACASFTASDRGVAAPPDDGGGGPPDGPAEAAATVCAFCDDFEREVVQGAWDTPPPSSDVTMTLDGPGWRGRRSLRMVATGDGELGRRYLSKTIALQPMAKAMTVSFAWRVPTGPVRQALILALRLMGGGLERETISFGFSQGAVGTYQSIGTKQGAEHGEVGGGPVRETWVPSEIIASLREEKVVLSMKMNDAVFAEYTSETLVADVDAFRVDLGIDYAAASTTDATVFYDDVRVTFTP